MDQNVSRYLTVNERCIIEYGHVTTEHWQEGFGSGVAALDICLILHVTENDNGNDNDNDNNFITVSIINLPAHGVN